MEFLVIAYALFAMIAIVVLFGRKGREEDNNLRRKKALGRDTIRADYKRMDTSFYERMIKPEIEKLSGNREEKNTDKSERKKKSEAQLALKLRKAGMHVSLSGFTFFKQAFGWIVFILSGGITVLLFTADPDNPKVIFILFAGAFIGFAGPELFLSSQIKKHQTAIKDQLADTIDLMGVCMEAGLSFDASLVKIAERMEGPFIDELMTVFKQIQLGKNRTDALKNLAEVSDVKELKTFVSAIVQAGQLGIPITNVLASQAEQLRLNKSEEIKEVAATIPTKMTIPTVLFILPSIFIVILGPVAFQIIDTFTKK